MPVPLSISELSTTPGSNSPSGSDSPSVLDDHQRTAYAFIKTLSDEKAAAADSVLLTGNQTVAGTKTFSSPIAGSVTGSAASVTGTVAIANGGTGQTTAAAAFTALKQAASETETGVVERLTTAEAQTGTDTTRYHSAATMKAAQIQLATSVALTTQTAVDFTGIPSWAKRITVMLSGVSSNGSSLIQVQLGISTGIEATGYSGKCVETSVGAGTAVTVLGVSFLPMRNNAAGSSFFGKVEISRFDTTNTWVASGGSVSTTTDSQFYLFGSKTLGGVLDRVRISTANGTDQLDAGSLNISYE